jgi:beta-glucanase (GH16 family)
LNKNKIQFHFIILSLFAIALLIHCHKAPLGDLELTFSDEFSDTILNRNIWKTNYDWGQGTGDEQKNIDSAVTIKDGILHLTAKRDTLVGVVYDENYNPVEKTFYYTSGLIQSENSFAQQYGYLEIRCKVPFGKGFWTSFWTMPFSGWPPEIDIFEISGQQPNGLHMTNHFSDKNGKPVQNTTTLYMTDLSKDFHVYGVEWNPKEIIWYFDGKKVFSSDIGVPQERMFLIASLSLNGGPFSGIADSSTFFPASFDIDYIRVYKRNN